MNSADKIKKLFKDAELSINSDADEKIFQDVFQARQKTKENTPAQPVHIWRLIMKNSLTKFSAAAVVLIACIAGLTMINTTSSVALANVLSLIEQFSAYSYQADMKTTTQMMGMETSQDMHLKVWMSQDRGMRMDMETTSLFGIVTLVQSYLIPERNEIITITPAQKTYIRMEIDGEQYDQRLKQSYSPTVMVEQLLEFGYKNLGKSTIDGIEVEGFQTNDPNSLGGLFGSGQMDIKLWVDVKTQLPVQMEMDIQSEDQTSLTMSGVIYGFQWDVPNDAETFEPVIPDDYILLTDSPYQISFDEETAIKGLKVFADILGKYPEKIDLLGLSSEMGKIQEIFQDEEKIPPYMKQLKEESKDLNFIEKMKKGMDWTIDWTMSTMGLSMFYMQLQQENKDPAYYGNIITPDDAGQVLMRWKVSDNEYRVIFGSLYAETVTADVLAELEKNLPK